MFALVYERVSVLPASVKVYGLPLNLFCMYIYIKSSIAEFKTNCHYCQRETRGVQCFHSGCRKFAFQCVICHIAVRGMLIERWREPCKLLCMTDLLAVFFVRWCSYARCIFVCACCRCVKFLPGVWSRRPRAAHGAVVQRAWRLCVWLWLLVPG